MIAAEQWYEYQRQYQRYGLDMRPEEESVSQRERRRQERVSRINDHLGEGKVARMMELDEDEAAFVKGLDLLTYKPVIYAANVAEEDAADDAEENEYVKAVREIAEAEGSEVVIISAKVEAELAELEDDERQMFLEEMGISESGLDKLIKSSYALLDLISFITTGEDEGLGYSLGNGAFACAAWPVDSYAEYVFHCSVSVSGSSWC